MEEKPVPTETTGQVSREDAFSLGLPGDRRGPLTLTPHHLPREAASIAHPKHWWQWKARSTERSLLSPGASASLLGWPQAPSKSLTREKRWLGSLGVGAAGFRLDTPGPGLGRRYRPRNGCVVSSTASAFDKCSVHSAAFANPGKRIFIHVPEYSG